MKKILLMMLCLVIGYVASAETIVSGTIIDEQDQPLIGGSVIVLGTTQGTSTDLDGSFKLTVREGEKIQISYLNYKTLTFDVEKNQATQDLGIIKMKPEVIAMEDIVISQSVAIQRRTPVAVATVPVQEIELKIGGQEFPEVLKSTPGVYVTKDGGGYGDSKINMRGFKSANVAVMINGVPVNDMEWGGLYWSNWAGLSDVTRSMQTQRGIGASKISSPSVGGTINIVTNTIDAKKGGTISYGVGNDGANTISASFSTGLMDNGWAMSALLAKRWGNGYIQGTGYSAYNWFINVSKRINDNHQLSLTAFGAPQTHNQRKPLYAGLSIEEWDKVAKWTGEKNKYRYNAVYGFDNNGKERSSMTNTYHKPQISLNHQWQIDHKSSLSTALYMSIGRGSGYSGQGRTSAYRSMWNGSSNGKLLYNFRKEDGTFDYGAIQDMNAASETGSNMIMSKSNNNHMWYGLLSTYTNEILPGLELSAGVDVRYYVGQHTNEIIDLYDGEYFIDDADRRNVKPENNIAALDPNWKNEKLTVGDIVYRDYDGHVHQEGVFAQLEYSIDKVNTFISGSFSNTGYWRVDRFYYDEAHQRSETINFLGFTVKAGANYNVTDKSNLFLNLGYISRAPFFSGGAFLQSTTSHMTNPDAVNEKVASIELGYGLHIKKFSMNINAYYTNWMDKSDVRSKLMSNGDYARVNLTGIDARHTGIELDFRYKPARWVNITGMLSWGDWIWSSNARGYYYDSQGQPMTAKMDGTIASGIMAEDHAWIELAQKGVHVAGSAQTTAAVGVDFFPFKGLRLSADFNLYANNYADFYLGSTAVANTVTTVNDPWKIPVGHQLDLSASYAFKIGKVNATIFGNVNNLYNYNYVMDAQCATDSKGWQDCYAVMYSFGRTYTVRLKISF
ncbi:MAG: carboxypeptidase-like regulatory domain-containing protein [Paludibacteraceae bacterium]|nr:carboxypeptidase-like regulatory domain-containing protein [Paludibacteraceae bacterium]